MSAELCFTLTCHDCQQAQRCGLEEMLRRLQGLGMLRRESRPAPDLICELFTANLTRMKCDHCGGQTLKLETAADDFTDWDDTVPCELCRQPIPRERLELFPHETRCAKCRDAGPISEDAPEFCPNCGDILRVQSSRTPGITRYVQVCRACGYQS